MTKPAPGSLESVGVFADDGPDAGPLLTMLRLHWFIRLRWVLLAGAAAVLVFERYFLPNATSGAERPAGLVAAIIALGVINLVWTGLSYLLFRALDDAAIAERSVRWRTSVFANAQVAVDLFLLTCILRYTGGVESPMAIFYLFHVAIVALLLSRWEAILQALWAMALYAGLVLAEWGGSFSEHYDFLPNHCIQLYAEPEFIIASLLIVACGIFGTLYFTLQIARRLENRDRRLRAANAALKQSQVAIQDLQRRRSRFMQTAAHQLKSPLAVIQTLTDLIRCNIVPPDAIPGTCEKIVKRCQDGISQVSELLTLARVQEADPVRHSRSDADVAKVVSELCERLGSVARDRHVDLTCNISDNMELRVNVDPQDLGDCVGNLIENAIKYTPEGGSVDVILAADSDPPLAKTVSVSVTDTGIGINPELLQPPDGVPGHEPVFDAFRRGNNALAAGIPGTGLGLSIVREVVEQAGGRLRVISRPDEGSTFTVTFPAYRGADAAVPLRNTRASEIVVE